MRTSYFFRKGKEIHVKIFLSELEFLYIGRLYKEMYIDTAIRRSQMLNLKIKWMIEVKLVSDAEETISINKTGEPPKDNPRVRYFNNTTLATRKFLTDTFTVSLYDTVTNCEALYIDLMYFTDLNVKADSEWLHRQPKDTYVDITIRKVKA